MIKGIIISLGLLIFVLLLGLGCGLKTGNLAVVVGIGLALFLLATIIASFIAGVLVYGSGVRLGSQTALDAQASDDRRDIAQMNALTRLGQFLSKPGLLPPNGRDDQALTIEYRDDF